MFLDRRAFLRNGAALLPALRTVSETGLIQESLRESGVGICDWNLGEPCDPELIPKAASAGLSAIQVSVGTSPDNVPLRSAEVRSRYLELGRQHGVVFPSVAAGGILNAIPLKSEPEAAVYVIDALEAASALGSDCILTAFFGDADLRARDEAGEYQNVSEGPYAEYTLDEKGLERVIAAFKQIAPRAEDLGVFLGLENTLSAGQNLAIIDEIASPSVQVYYDVGNSTAYGYDVDSELRLLGRERICEIHMKETLGLDDPMWGVLGAPAAGGVDFGMVERALADIGFDKWLVLETGGRRNHFEEDTRRNVAFIRSRFLDG